MKSINEYINESFKSNDDEIFQTLLDKILSSRELSDYKKEKVTYNKFPLSWGDLINKFDDDSFYVACNDSDEIQISTLYKYDDNLMYGLNFIFEREGDDIIYYGYETLLYCEYWKFINGNYMRYTKVPHFGELLDESNIEDIFEIIIDKVNILNKFVSSNKNKFDKISDILTVANEVGHNTKVKYFLDYNKLFK